MELRDVTEDDLLTFYEQQREPEANQMARFPARQLDAFLAHWRKNVLGGEGTRKKTIVVDGQVAGNVVSWPSGERRLVGYWIGKAHWGRGVATAALREFVRDHEKTRPLHAYVALENVSSIRVLEKCGFRRLGDGTVGSDGVRELMMELTGDC